MLRRAQLVNLFLVLVLLAPLSGAADQLQKLRQKLARERDADDRAKITVKIGQELLARVARAYKEGDLDEGTRLLGEYRDAIRAAHQGLVQSGRDARKKPKGFKDLEIHLRKSARELGDVGRLLTFDQRGPLQEALDEMNAIRQELLSKLFRVMEEPDSDDRS